MTIRAFVRVAIKLSSKYVYLRGTAGHTITKAIEVRSKRDKPLKLETDLFDLSKKVIYRIEEIDEGKIYLIHFNNIPGPAETYHGVLRLKTNYPEKPEITIRIRGIFRNQKPPVS